MALNFEKINDLIKEKENNLPVGLLAKERELDKQRYRRRMLMGCEEETIMTADGKYSKGGVHKIGGKGIFEIIVGRPMTEGEFMEFEEKWEKAPDGWGINQYIKEKEIEIKK